MTTSWTKVTKASGTSWTKISKATNADHTVSTVVGSPIGLLLALTYATTSSVATGIWTDIPKASGTSWTKITKAT
jgi:hypothetical protein